MTNQMKEAQDLKLSQLEHVEKVQCDSGVCLTRTNITLLDTATLCG